MFLNLNLDSTKTQEALCCCIFGSFVLLPGVDSQPHPGLNQSFLRLQAEQVRVLSDKPLGPAKSKLPTLSDGVVPSVDRMMVLPMLITQKPGLLPWSSPCLIFAANQG